MKRSDFNKYIESADFKSMFNEMGWDKTNSGYDTTLTIDDKDFEFISVAQKSGFIVFTCHSDETVNPTLCKRIDSKLKRWSNDYICIFLYPESGHHLWMVPVKTVEKREPVYVEYTNLSQSDFLFSKMADISFDLDEETTIVDVKACVQSVFEVNSAKITKDFYTGFKKEHNAFADFITGIDVINDRQWYASVMLNRLMFCYFIQKKGFLNSDFDYLRNKFNWVREQRGENKFFSTFYKGFLCRLFHGGLNSPKHSDDFEDVYGRIPYLNGGMFDEHQLEKQYAEVDISDEAFDRLFDFFDKWRWHLDTRITASGKDINPDVLGYIFEQYINDRAQMGAYYTKEDITEYIGKNCIIPYLVDEVSKTSSAKDFKSDGYVWTYLKNSGDKYIYDAVKKGYTEDFAQKLPENISIGLDTTQSNLLERRSNWNDKTPDDFALPTEIWRETIERLKHCDEVLRKIKAGEITHINDFITYNLDIRQFVYDLIENSTDHLFVRHFYAALRKITILDPTCGSGAFLFAAMNILEPLYQVCIERMEDFHEKNDNLFKDELGEIENKYRSNIQYFIYKSIILHNLYGVDIMVEATEIAKLRLFLKMVAVVDVDKHADNLGLDPLPDIDFNIRCGNTLVGYATEEELNNSLNFGDMFAKQEFETKVRDEMNKVAKANERFKEVQFNSNEDIAAFKAAKADLNNRLSKLNELLNHHLYGKEPDFGYTKWYTNTKPFHWLAEFYQIIHDNGGFDVVIGNPPYVEYSKVKELYSININLFSTIKCANLHAFIAERSFSLGTNSLKLGLIVPLPSINTVRMESLQKIIKPINSQITWISAFDERPSGLFNGVDQRLIIEIISKTRCDEHQLYSTGINRWQSKDRDILFCKIEYVKHDIYVMQLTTTILKLEDKIELSILNKFYQNKPILNDKNKSLGNDRIFYRSAGGRYWKVFLSKSFGTNNSSEKEASFNNYSSFQMISVLSSDVFWWYYSSHFDMFNLGDYQIFGFRFNSTDTWILNKLHQLGIQYEESLNANAIDNSIQTNHGIVVQKQYYIRLSKSIINKIDCVLAKHYGLTDEELDFIINYDIKYRMGDELN
jgi:hypothetical protein